MAILSEKLRNVQQREWMMPKRSMQINPEADSTAPIAPELPPRNQDVVRLDGSVLLIRKFVARADEDQYQRFDLAKQHLPPTPLSPRPVTFFSRLDLVAPLVTALNRYAQRTGPGCKTTHTQIAQACRAMLKFIEYGWLNRMYKLSDWTAEAASGLLVELGQGGWAHALDVVKRSQVAIADMPSEAMKGYITTSHAKSGGYSIRD